jgi:hypothetical protein
VISSLDEVIFSPLSQLLDRIETLNSYALKILPATRCSS